MTGLYVAGAIAAVAVVAMFIALAVWTHRVQGEVDDARDSALQTDDQRRATQLVIGLTLPNNSGGMGGP